MAFTTSPNPPLPKRPSSTKSIAYLDIESPFSTDIESCLTRLGRGAARAMDEDIRDCVGDDGAYSKTGALVRKNSYGSSSKARGLFLASSLKNPRRSSFKASDK